MKQSPAAALAARTKRTRKYRRDCALTRLLNQHGLTSQQVGRAVGVHASAMSHYIHGRRTPTLRNARKLAEFFGVAIEELFHD